MKLWCQSFMDPGQQPQYFERLGRRLSSLVGPDRSITISGLSPPDLEIHRGGELRGPVIVVGNALAAEDRGYDAVVFGHFRDAELYEARSAVGVPVVGMGESSMLYASTLGRHFGFVAFDERFVPVHLEQVERYGLSSRLAGVEVAPARASDLAAAIAHNPSGALDPFWQAADRLIQRGTGVIVPDGGLCALLLTAGGAAPRCARPVVDPIAITVCFAEMAAALASSGSAPDRVRSVPLPSARGQNELAQAARRQGEPLVCSDVTGPLPSDTPEP